MQLASRLLWLSLFVATLVLGWQLAARNSTAVEIDYVLGRFTGVALWVVLLAAFAAGAATVAGIASYRLFKLRLLARRYRKAVTGLEAEVHQLRNLPLGSDDLSPDRAEGFDAHSREPTGRGV